MVQHKIVAIGEVLWDLLPAGKQLGGAPANLAYQAHALGADARVITRVGDDELGRLVLERFREMGLPTDSVVTDSDSPTGTVSVELGADGSPKYTIQERVAWDRISADDPGVSFVKAADAVCFGTLAQRTEPARRAIQTLAISAPAEALRVLDLNLRAPFFSRDVIEQSLEIASVLKLNDDELETLARLFNLTGKVRQQMTALARKFELQLVALTRGSHGSLLMKDGEWSDHPGLPVEVKDTIGAGDAFAASLTVGLLAGQPLDEINNRAAELAAYVCSQSGGMPDIPARYRTERG